VPLDAGHFVCIPQVYILGNLILKARAEVVGSAELSFAGDAVGGEAVDVAFSQFIADMDGFFLAVELLAEEVFGVLPGGWAEELSAFAAQLIVAGGELVAFVLEPIAGRAVALRVLRPAGALGRVLVA
jgi:phage-related protein